MKLNSFHERILLSIDTLGIDVQQLFGTIGIYVRGRFVGMMTKDELYLRVDQETKQEFNTQPFVVSHKQTLKNFHRVPNDILENNTTLRAYVKKAREIYL